MSSVVGSAPTPRRRAAEPAPAAAVAAPDDRTARARILDAAIALVADRGPRGLSARRVAAAAGVSPGLVIHHFGSMDALRTACDERVAALIAEQKHAALSAGASLDVLALLRRSDAGPLAAYLAAVLGEDSPAVSALVDELVDDAEAYLDDGVASGMLLPAADPRGRAVVLTLWSLGALVLSRHLERQLGVDLAATGAHDQRDPAALAAYLRPVTEIYSAGLFTDAFAARMRAAVEGMTPPSRPTPEGGDR